MSYVETSHAASVWAAYLARERRAARRPGAPKDAKRPAGPSRGPGQPRPDRGAHGPGDEPTARDEPAAA